MNIDITFVWFYSATQLVPEILQEWAPRVFLISDAWKWTLLCWCDFKPGKQTWNIAVLNNSALKTYTILLNTKYCQLTDLTWWLKCLTLSYDISVFNLTISSYQRDLLVQKNRLGSDSGEWFRNESSLYQFFRWSNWD
jgi:hypothetical protein